MNWKQPIPTNLDELFGNDYLSQDIYIWVLLHASNKETKVNLNGKIIILKRGQCYSTITKLACRFKRNTKTIKKYIKLLKSLHNVLDYAIYPQGIVFTIKSYDEVIKMDSGLGNDSDNEGTTTTERLPTNKSDKNAKSASDSFISAKHNAWDNYSSSYLKSLRISDPAFIEAARQAFYSKANVATENAVRMFIDTQRKITSPDMADYKSELWPDDKEVQNG